MTEKGGAGFQFGDKQMLKSSVHGKSRQGFFRFKENSKSPVQGKT